MILPVGDREEFLAEAIESVLAQTFGDFELLVVLDGVSEGVSGIVHGYADERIRVTALPLNLGVSTARNVGLRLARAPYIALMDSDDVAMPRRFEQQLRWLDAHPHVTVCGSNSIKRLSSGREVPMRYPRTDGMIKARMLLVDAAILNPTAMFRAEFVQRHCIQYDPMLARDQDHMFYVEMILRGATFHGLQESLLLYRRHATNGTCDMSRFDEAKTRVRERLLPLFFPSLTGQEFQALAVGMCDRTPVSSRQLGEFVTAARKAGEESRSLVGEDRREIRRILAVYLKRAMDKLGMESRR